MAKARAKRIRRTREELGLEPAGVVVCARINPERRAQLVAIAEFRGMKPSALAAEILEKAIGETVSSSK